MTIALTRHSQFYESQLLTTQLSFLSCKECNYDVHVIKRFNEIPYLSNRKLCNFYVNLTVAYDHIKRNFLFSFIKDRPLSSGSVEFMDLLEELYRSTNLHMLAEELNTESIHTSVRIRQ